MKKTSRDATVEDHSQLDAAAILLSLKTTPPSFPKKFNDQLENGEAAEGNTTGYIPIYDWTQAIPSLSYAGNTYNINLQMYNSPVRLVPVPLNEENNDSYKEMSIAFVKFCQIHRDTILLHNPSLTADKVNEKLVQLWTHLPDDEKVVYSKVAKNEILLMQGKDISSGESHIKVEQCAEDSNQIFQQSMEKCSPSLFRHPMCAATESSKHEGADKNFKQKPSPSPIPKPVKGGKQRSLSLSEKPMHRIYIRRTVSQEEVSNKDNFAKPNTPENTANNKKYLVRMRRHSMNDSILTSALEKINPYFTKSYTRSPHKVRNDYTKTTYSTHSPKRNISVTSFDTDPSTMMKSPPKKNKNLPIEADIFDFKSEPHGVQVKTEPEDEYNGEDMRKAETYSYSLLKGASKTSSVNPCFSSRKTFVKKMNSIPSKCVNRLRQEYCSKKGKSSGCGNSEKQTMSDSSFKQIHMGTSPSHRQFTKNHFVQNVHSSGKFDPNLVHKVVHHKSHTQMGNNSSKTASNCSNLQLHATTMRNQGGLSVSPTISTATSDATMVTSSSVDSLKSANSSSSGESSKMELLNDSALLSYAIAELESAEVCKLKSSRRSQASGNQTAPDTRYRHVYNFFREHGLNPTQEQVNEFYASHRDSFSCKSAAYLTIREVKQKIIKLQLM